MRWLLAAVLALGSVVAGWRALSASPEVEASPLIVASAESILPTTRWAPPASAPPTSVPVETTVVPRLPHPTVPSTLASPPGPGPPEDLVDDLEALVTDDRLAGLDVSVSVWHEDYDVAFASNPDLALFPASNQKLLTAVGALGLLPADFRFTTEIALGGDDLILVAGGDPTLKSVDLDGLAQAVAAAGVTGVRGRLVVDAGRYDSARMAPGWQDWQMPTYVGPLSTFIVNDNRHRSDPEYLAEPNLGNAELLRAALDRAGVTVRGLTVLGTRPAEAEGLVALDSADRDTLVARLLTSSDNEIAEALVREIGFVANGVGSTSSGTAAIEEYVASLGVDLTGQSGDGSGLSRANLRSASELQALLVAAQGAEWWPTFRDSLAVAGRTGTLAGRLGAPVTAGNVLAKSGSIIGGRSLSGVLEDRSGQTVVFSFVVNGGNAGAAVPVIDEFVVTLAGHA